MNNQPGNGHDIHGEQIRHADIAYDRTDLGASSIFAFLGSMVVAGVLVLIVVWGFMRYLQGFTSLSPTRRPASIYARTEAPTGDPRSRFPSPRLQSDEAGDMSRFRAGNDHILNSYDWVDRDAGVVRIPVSRAMEILAQSGLPTRQTEGAGSAAASATRQPDRTSRPAAAAEAVRK